MRLRLIMVGFVLTGVAGLTVGCGGGGGGRPGAAPTPSPTRNLTAVWAKWAACMRSHGVAVSDPVLDKDNHPLYNYAAAAGVPESVKQSARTACQSIVAGLPGGELPSANPSTIGMRVKYSQCIRAHGIAAFPDPDPSSGVWRLNPQQVDVHSAAFQQAQKACRPLLRGAN